MQLLALSLIILSWLATITKKITKTTTRFLHFNSVIFGRTAMIYCAWPLRNSSHVTDLKETNSYTCKFKHVIRKIWNVFICKYWTLTINVYWKLLILTPFLLHLMTWHVQGHAWHTSLNQYSSSFNRDQPCPKINISRSIPIIGNTVILCIYIPIRYVETTEILIEHLPCFVFRNAAIIVDVQPGEGNLCHHHFFFRQQVN